jgi:outer membrane lipoprotein-sorting protein
VKLRYAVIIPIIVIASISAVRLALPARHIDAVAALRQAYASDRNLTYEGSVTTTVFCGGKERQTQSFVRHKGSAERIDYPSSPVRGAVVVNTEHETRAYRPDMKQVAISYASKERQDTSGLDLIIKSYSISGKEDGEVAGRAVNLITMEPKHYSGPVKRLWIDRKTGVILKSEDICTSGRLRSSMEFSRISYSAKVADEVFANPVKVDASWTTDRGEPEMARADVEKVLGVPLATPRHLPGGFVLDSIRLYTCKCCGGHKAAHLRYTDGLNSVSIFETPSDSSCRSGRCRVHCAKSGSCEVTDASLAHVATVSSGKLSIVVVADLTEEDLTKIAKSTR